MTLADELPDGRYAAIPAAAGVRNGGVSFWYRQAGLPTPRAPLPGDVDADVCIVGGGLTGLWTAYYLKQAEPELRIVLLEREFAGYGASGRNGGWLSAEVAAPAETYLRGSGREGVLALHRAMRATKTTPSLTMSASMPSRAATSMTSSTVVRIARCRASTPSRPEPRR